MMLPSGSKRPRRFLVLLPLVVFAGLAWLFLSRIGTGDPSRLPSPLIGKAIPDFELSAIDGLTVSGLKSTDLATGVILVNVFASWCAPCRTEHPLLAALAADGRFRLVGIDYKDGADQVRRFLGALGNPYAAIGADRDGRVGIDWGVYGVPETYVVANGRIVFKLVGPITSDGLKSTLMPEIDKALAANQGTGNP
jgi:cytochrome c biogenesis protein CcmG, thiol:disulfide interchange protein DsbE